jgi:hypothetical protein
MHPRSQKDALPDTTGDHSSHAVGCFGYVICSQSGVSGINLNELSKRKSVQIALCVCSVLFSAYCIRGFVDLVRQTHTRYVMREFSAAVDELQKSPPGFHRAEVFLKKVKAIDPGYAPADVKEALHDYVSAMEYGIVAAKSGQDATQYDPAIADAKQRLISSAKKYN